MNNIADANATEMRGWVMLMLQRAAENVNPSECNDPAVLLACSLGSDSCPAACVKDSSDENNNEEDEGARLLSRRSHGRIHGERCELRSSS